MRLRRRRDHRCFPVSISFCLIGLSSFSCRLDRRISRWRLSSRRGSRSGALAETKLAVAEPPAHREAQEDPSPLPRRRARALLASCLMTGRCALAPVRRGVRCFLLQIHWQTLKRRSGIQQQFEGECLGHGTHPARKCACLKSLALFPGTPDSSTRW